MSLSGLSFDDTFAFKRNDVAAIHANFLDCIDQGAIRTRVRKSIRSFESLGGMHLYGVLGRRFLLGIGHVFGDDVQPYEVFTALVGDNPDFTFFAKFYTIVYRSLDDAARAKLARHFFGLLDPTNDVGTLFSELLIAVAYASSGCEVTFTDFGGKSGEPEFKVSKDSNTMEVEVKTISSLSGQPIQERPFSQIWDRFGVFTSRRGDFFKNCFFTMGIKGRHPDVKGEILNSIEHCISQLWRPREIVGHGKVTLSYDRVPEDQLEATRERASATGAFGAYIYIPTPSSIVALYKSDDAARIGDSVERQLGEGFKKFVRGAAAIVWLRLRDVIPPVFREPNPLPGDAVLDDPNVQRKIATYLARKTFGYPTGIMLSPGVTSQATSFGYQLRLVTCFLPNKVKSFDHSRFLPEVFPILPRPLYHPDLG